MSVRQDEVPDRDRDKILEVAERLARQPDGTLNPALARNREVRLLSGKNGNVVCAVLREWREGFPRQSEPKLPHKGKSRSTKQKQLTAFSQAEEQARELIELRLKVSELEAARASEQTAYGSSQNHVSAARIATSALDTEPVHPAIANEIIKPMLEHGAITTKTNGSRVQSEGGKKGTRVSAVAPRSMIPSERRISNGQKLSDRLENRNKFGDFAFEFIAKADLPRGSTEIYDAYVNDHRDEKGWEAGFGRGYAHTALDRCDHPDLAKLPNGAWFQKGKPVPERADWGIHHSRLRSECYGEIAKIAACRITDLQRPMTAKELLSDLPEGLRLPGNDRHEILRMASRLEPQLYRLRDKTWFLRSLDRPGRNATSEYTSRDQLAAAVIKLLRVRGPLEASKIRPLLSKVLQRAFPRIARDLERAQLHFPQLVQGADLRWAVIESRRATADDGQFVRKSY